MGKIVREKIDNLNLTNDDLLNELRHLENIAGLPEFNLESYQDVQVQIKPDEKVSPGNFKPSSFQAGLYYAHPRTIEAMKKNILTAGEDIDALKQPYQCYKCNNELDIQFWHFCPHCGSEFKD